MVNPPAGAHGGLESFVTPSAATGVSQPPPIVLPVITPHRPITARVDVTYPIVFPPEEFTLEETLSSVRSALLQTVTAERGEVCIVFKGSPYETYAQLSEALRNEIGFRNPNSKYIGRVKLQDIDPRCTIQQAMEVAYQMGIGTYRVPMMPGDTFRDQTITTKLARAL